MTTDLKKMSRKELEKLARDVEKALDKLRKQDLKKVRQDLKKVAAAAGVTIEEALGLDTAPKAAKSKKKSAKSKAKMKSPAKFANPNNSSQTWTGKGRQPEWYKAAIAAGKSADSMAI